jgi:hypothetical protein
MMRGQSKRTGWRAAGFCLALLALVLKVSLPAGFMLAADEHQRIAVTLCSGQGPVEALLDLSTGEIVEHGSGHGDNSKANHDQPCAFAVATISAVAPTEPAIAAPAFASIAFKRAALHERPQLTPTGPPLPARGPPQYA